MSASLPISLRVTYSRPCSCGPLRVRVRVPHDHAHPEALEDLAGDLADLARPDQPDGLAVHVEADQPVEGEVHVAHAAVGLRDVPVERQREGDRVLCHGVRGVRGHPRHEQPVIGGGLEVDPVESGAAQGDHLHALGRQHLDDLTGHLVVDEDAHDVDVVAHRLHRVGIEAVLAELGGEAGSDQGLAEVVAVVLLGVEHGDGGHGVNATGGVVPVAIPAVARATPMTRRCGRVPTWPGPDVRCARWRRGSPRSPWPPRQPSAGWPGAPTPRHRR